MTRSDNTHHLRRAAAARHDAALRRARDAIEELDRDAGTITFTSVAHAAGVSRGWLYNQTDLREVIVALRCRQLARPTTTIPTAQRATAESLRQRLDSARHEIIRLRADNAAMREQLARNLGEQRLRH